MKNKRNSIAVVGCGWLGLPFSQQMIHNGWSVNGSTTNLEKTRELKNLGIESYLLKLPEMRQIDPALFNVDVLLINIPPGRKDPGVLSKYPKSINKILIGAKSVNTIKKIIFISSTSVYGNTEDLINESSETFPVTNSGKAILAAENSIINSGKPYVILRFGGLAGPHRHPGRFLAGRKGLASGNQSINFLHLDDAVGIIDYMCHNPIENETFNVVAPAHPGKKEFYIEMASSIGLEPSTFIEGIDQAKREISVRKLLEKTDYKFVYPDPMKFTF